MRLDEEGEQIRRIFWDEKRNLCEIFLLWLARHSHRLSPGHAYPSLYKQVILIQDSTPPAAMPRRFLICYVTCYVTNPANKKAGLSRLAFLMNNFRKIIQLLVFLPASLVPSKEKTSAPPKALAQLQELQPAFPVPSARPESLGSYHLS
ncbi:MAG: hypothetical protein V1814_00495 [Candidatus Moraniibacteriota bacterium]